MIKNETDRKIRAAKKRNRNIFRKIRVEKNTWLNLVYGLLLSSAVVGALADFSGVANLAVTAVLSFVVTLLKQLQEAQEPPERFRPNDAFVGLYSEAEDKSWYIPRGSEVKALRKLIRRDFRECGKIKKGICLVGASGSGKSILLEMLKPELSPKYEVLDFSQAYYDLNSEPWILGTQEGDARPKVCIFDQFEQVLQLDEHADIFSLIRTMKKNGAMLIFSLREEYLRAFVGEWLMDESADESGAALTVQYLLPEGRKNSGTEGKRLEKGPSGKEADRTHRRASAHGVPDIVMVGGKSGHEEKDDFVKQMLLRCERIPDYGIAAWEKVKDRSLIEQQIILNMMSRPEQLPRSAIRAFAEKDDSELMKAYYDVQLGSTGDYFMACRILYFLSRARLENHAIYHEVLQEAVCVAGGKEQERFEACLEKLKEMHLIKGEKTGDLQQRILLSTLQENQREKAARDGVRYEVSHDFIAQNFAAYANQALPPNIRAALDDYRATHELSARKRSEASGTWRAFTEKAENSGWITVVWILSLAAVLLRFALQQMVELSGGIGNLMKQIFSLPEGLLPDTGGLDRLIHGSGNLSVPVMVLSVLSLFYIYNFYRNITQFYGIGVYRGTILEERTGGKRRRRWIVTLLYLLSMASGVAAACAGERWLFFLGMGNLLNGTACILVSLDTSVGPNGRGSYLAYGVKTAICSMLMMTGSLAAAWMETAAGYGMDMKELIQEWIMATLLLYSYHQHLNQMFIYVHVQALLHGERI